MIHRGICGPTTILKAQFQGIVLCNHKITLEIRFNYHFHLSNTFHKVTLKSFARQNITLKVITYNNERTRKTNQQTRLSWELRFRTLFKIITSDYHLREFINWFQRGKLLGKINEPCFLKEVFSFLQRANASCWLPQEAVADHNVRNMSSKSSYFHYKSQYIQHYRWKRCAR